MVTEKAKHQVQDDGGFSISYLSAQSCRVIHVREGAYRILREGVGQNGKAQARVPKQNIHLIWCVCLLKECDFSWEGRVFMHGFILNH